jgi:sarcosine oxidase delta subunit
MYGQGCRAHFSKTRARLSYRFDQAVRKVSPGHADATAEAGQHKKLG